MKSTSPAVTSLLSTEMASPDAQVLFAECFTFTMTTGAVYAWTNFDLPVVYNGYTFLADGPLVQGLKYKASVGLDVDKQQMTIAARPTDLINGTPLLAALRDGAFDGASVRRDRVFLSGPSWLGSDAVGGFAVGASAIDAVGVVGVVGGVTMFKGRISTVDSVGRTSAALTVASDLVILDYEMPRNLFSPTCVHTLYDSGCGVIRGTHAAAGAVVAGSTAGVILSDTAAAQHAQGALIFSSGANANIRATVKSVSIGIGFNLIYPLPFAPSAGDAFTVYDGCDHTLATCQARFANKANFRGFPFVPPIETAY